MSAGGRLKTIPERVAAFRAWHARANGRPLLGFFRGSEYPLHRYEAARRLPAHRPLRPEDLDAAAFVADSDRLFAECEACGGDFIWTASAFWGVPWLEAALGCPIQADPETGSIHARAPPSFAGPASIPPFSLECPWARKLCELLDALAAEGEPHWPIGTTRLRGISDLLATLYGPEELLLAMMDRPEEVEEVARRVTELWIAFGRMQLERIPLFHGGIGSFYYEAWAPAGTVWHQEDSVALLSPPLFERFVRPFDEAIVRAFPRCILHLHPAGFLPLERYLEMGFGAIELHVDVGGPRARELREKHLAILERLPLLVWGKLEEDDLEWLIGRLPPRGLAVLAVVSGPEEAEVIWELHERILSTGGCAGACGRRPPGRTSTGQGTASDSLGSQ